jgi:hypothetical protein
VVAHQRRLKVAQTVIKLTKAKPMLARTVIKRMLLIMLSIMANPVKDKIINNTINSTISNTTLSIQAMTRMLLALLPLSPKLLLKRRIKHFYTQKQKIEFVLLLIV